MRVEMQNNLCLKPVHSLALIGSLNQGLGSDPKHRSINPGLGDHQESLVFKPAELLTHNKGTAIVWKEA